MRLALLALVALLPACADRAAPAKPSPTNRPMAAERGRPAPMDEHVAALKKRMPRGFSLVVSPPFVVLGDQRPEQVEGHAEHTVAWAVSKLKQDFFRADPKEILDIWLFFGAESYERNTYALFRERPSTPYGYYSSQHKALIMNIATGGGTLVHEIVHPFVEADFPDAPSWLNEGLGSLFEQCGERDGHIVGYPNWRLPGLQEAIAKHQVPSFEALTATGAHAFYDEDPGTNYGQSRYLLYYLQEKGLLTRFYREFREGHAADPTGLATLKRVLGEPDMGAFKTRWETWVSRLRFPSE
jgi:hypothetical protein